LRLCCARVIFQKTKVLPIPLFPGSYNTLCG
jgi:hypothetical protein